VYRHVNHAFTALFVLALLAAIPRQSAAVGGEVPAGNVSVQESEAYSETTASEILDSVQAEMPLAELKVETHTNSAVSAGYRTLSYDRYAGRAAEYTDLHSSPTFGAMYSILGKDHKFAVEGSYITDRDYHGDLTYDYMGAYRLHLRTESLYHNLDHQQLAAPTSILLSDSDPAARYGIRVEQDLAAMRIRLGNNPMHLNLGYWRMYKKGTSQQIFADQAFPPPNAPNSIYSKSRPVDSQTHEGKLGFDAHFGPLDLIYDFTIRQFNDHAGISRNDFTGRIITPPPPNWFNRPQGNYEHNEALESRYLSHTVKLHTEQTGGIVAAASYSYGQRKNLSSLSDVSGVNGLSTTLQNAAGDFVYTPCKEFSLAVRFRHQEIDRDTASNLVYSPATPSLIPTLPAIDTTKDIVSTTLSIRPTDILTVKGEYRGEFTHRENIDQWNRPDSMAIPENTATHRGILTLLSRPLKGLRIKARYSYTTTDNPAYGTSADERHEGQLLAVYTVKDRWGITANYQNSYEENNSSEITTTSIPSPLPRERRAMNATATVWGSIMQQLTLSGSAGLLRTKTDQDVLFAATQAGSVAASNYTSQAVLYSINAAYRATEKLGLNLMFQQVRSNAEFDPAFLQFTVTNPDDNSTYGVKSISWLKTVENSVNFSADYALARNISCGVAYSYRSYNDDRNSAYDGSLHSVTGTLTAKW
jgi:hypothetical protein